MSRLLDGLNDAQRDAVISQHPRILVLAGAGSGKTRTAISRVAYLNENRVSCRNMLCLTFTRLAGMEMKQRAITLLGKKEASKLFANTIHAWCVKVLQEHGDLLGYSQGFTIYDQEDSEAVLEDVTQELNYKGTKKAVFEYFANPPDAETECITKEDAELQNIMSEYHSRLKRNNAFDFDGLIRNTIAVLRDHPDVAGEYHKLYDYAFVDEFQDIDDRQWELINLINPINLFVVGDDNQSLYSWRGANIGIIMGLSQDPAWEVIKLERNYRSTMPIIASANRLIKYNQQTEKVLITEKAGDPVHYSEESDPDQETDCIAANIFGEMETDYGDVAVLVRTNRELENIYERFQAHKLPSILVSNKDDVFKKQDVRNIMAYLGLLINPKDNKCFSKAVAFPEPYLDALNMRILELEATTNEASLFHMFCTMFPENKFTLLFKNIVCFTPRDILASEVFDMIYENLNLGQFYASKGLTNRIAEASAAKTEISKWIMRQDEIGEDNSLQAFIEWLKLRDIQEKLSDKSNKVRLMTVHAAKGLEFDTVYVAGMNQGSFPNKRSDLQEERRLFYVAITRAKRNLHISHSMATFDWGGKRQAAKASQFLEEMKL